MMDRSRRFEQRRKNGQNGGARVLSIAREFRVGRVCGFHTSELQAAAKMDGLQVRAMEVKAPLIGLFDSNDDFNVIVGCIIKNFKNFAESLTFLSERR
jgi:hypothetical protein